MSISCIVLHHCFSVYEGWPPNPLSGELPWYAELVSNILKYAGLGIFTFISGYCFYYTGRKCPAFFPMIWKKIKRILFPAFVFGIAYCLLFPQYMLGLWMSPINGTHLWYLPMLFLCMLVGCVCFYGSRKAMLLSIMIYAAISVVSMEIFPLRTFEEFSVYYPFFIAGYVFNRRGLLHESIFKKYIVTDVLSNQSFKIYLLHQFVINAMLLYGCNYLSVMKYYRTIPILFVISIILPIVMGIVWDKLTLKMQSR